MAPWGTRAEGRSRNYVVLVWGVASAGCTGAWLWITNLVILLGAELNAELERGRQIEAGHPPDKEPFLPPREPSDDR